MLEGLADHGELIRSESPEDATELCVAHSPELVIISVGSPAREEFLCATRIKHEYPNVKVCIVIDTNNDTLLKASEASGADIVVPGKRFAGGADAAFPDIRKSTTGFSRKRIPIPLFITKL